MNPDLPNGESGASQVDVIMAGTFSIDLENQIITVAEDRTSELNYNITGFLGSACPGGCFHFKITEINGTVLTIELDLENPTSLQVYDVRLIYLNLYGKSVLNPDSYTDLFTKGRIVPFTAFAKESAQRAFPKGPGAHDTEILSLDFPPGSLVAVDFIIVASYPSNTGDPYEMNGMNVSGALTLSGGSAELSLNVLDHQDNVSLVAADTRVLTGGYTVFHKDPTIPDKYAATISNSAGAPIGTYVILSRADSPNQHNAHTYNYFIVEVREGGGPVAVIESVPAPPNAFTCQFIRYDGSSSYDDSGYNIVSYEWDWDYVGNPAGFIADKVTTTPYAKHQYSTEGSHSTALRVVNDAPSPQTSEPASLTHILIRPSSYSVKEINRITDNGVYEALWLPNSNSVVVDNNDVIHSFVSYEGNMAHIAYDHGITTQEFLGGLPGQGSASAQVDSQGFVHVAWGNQNSCYYSNNTSGSFTQGSLLANCWESSPYTSSLGINGRDELMFVWYEAFSTTHPMSYMIRSSGGFWSAPVIIMNPPISTGYPNTELALQTGVSGTPGDDGHDFHLVWHEQYTDGYMNPVVCYSKFDRDTNTWTPKEYVALHLMHYQDWSDISVTSDGDVFIGSSYYWMDPFVSRKDAVTGNWTTWMIMQTSHDEYTSTLAANDDGTICIAYWERVGYPDPDPFEMHYKIFRETMSQAEVDAIAPRSVDPNTSYGYYYGDIYMKECDFYMVFQDWRDSAGATPELYYARIGHD